MIQKIRAAWRQHGQQGIPLASRGNAVQRADDSGDIVWYDDYNAFSDKAALWHEFGFCNQ